MHHDCAYAIVETIKCLHLNRKTTAYSFQARVYTMIMARHFAMSHECNKAIRLYTPNTNDLCSDDYDYDEFNYQ